MGTKQPVSVLVIIHTQALDVLLLERAGFPDGWQSVTGSREANETLWQTALREIQEETGLAPAAPQLADWGLCTRFEIWERWRDRYPPGVTHNTEHVFGLQLPERAVIRLSPTEHSRHLWLPWQQAANKVFSPSNAQAIRLLPILGGVNE